MVHEGLSVVGNDFTGWWVYIVGPVIGAAIAVAIIMAVRGLPKRKSVRPLRAATCRSLAPRLRPRMATEEGKPPSATATRHR
jgi:Major intrinsic protein